ncbi:MAG: MFS transporter [Verrucomicrobia bacterium]|nr:MFS transporter [Verrucomicrobiota bacterium]
MSTEQVKASRFFAHGHYRWIICTLLFFATTINYMDRQVIGILAPLLGKEIGWNEQQYANIVFSFQFAYAIGMLLSGPLIDKLGTRYGYALMLFVWSLAGAWHGMMRSVMGFIAARFALGLGEAGNFPAAIKTVAEWFPRKERAFATGLLNAGTNVGAIITPLIVPWITLHLGWEWAFYLIGFVGLIWLAFWMPMYHRPQEHPKLTKVELDHIMSDPPETSTKIPWLQLLPHRQTWAFVVGKFLPDAVWWFYLYWAPKFLYNNFGVDLKHVGLPLVIIYLVADVGSVGGGWMSSYMIKRGWSVNAARKLTMLLCALCIVPVTFAPMATNLWVAVGLIGIAAAAHQGWSANIFTFASDMFPRRAVASVVGIGGFAGAVGGMILSQVIGHVLQATGGNYVPIFIIAAGIYLSAILIIHLLAPKMKPADLGEHTAPVS